MIVVDTNIIAYATFPSDHTEAVLQLHEFDFEWQVPILWRSEYLNVVSLYLRKRIIAMDRALEAIETASNFVGDNEHILSPFLVLNTLASSTCSSYDCEFVTLAAQLNTKLITYDKKILTEFPCIAMNPHDYLAHAQ
jgi:predicted nucleic acid-binding protein